MTSPTLAAATAVAFVWCGMVLAISFLEAPLKFRAAGVDLRVGLGIGRLVFRALNGVESVLAAGLIVAIAVGGPPAGTVAAAVVTVVVLGIQLGVLRRRLTRRSDRIIAGADAPRSRSHHAYIALEVIKLAALVVTGSLLLAT
jgi:hypothetical protein